LVESAYDLTSGQLECFDYQNHNFYISEMFWDDKAVYKGS